MGWEGEEKEEEKLIVSTRKQVRVACVMAFSMAGQREAQGIKTDRHRRNRVEVSAVRTSGAP